MIMFVIIIGFFLFFTGHDDPVDPPEVAFVYEHENELFEQAKNGNEKAIEKLIFVYSLVGNKEMEAKVIKVRDEFRAKNK
jgi:hypothetical protein